jgi:ferredoxin
VVADDADRRSSTDQRPTGFEPELGGGLRETGDNADRSGFEPELGGIVRQKGVFVDEATCIGCRYCSQVARNTFYIEPDYGRSRVIAQDGDPEDLVQEAIDTCPVDCIHWVNYSELKRLEAQRQIQVMKPVGFPVEQQFIFKHAPRKVRKRS